jgi:signal transduction histidine kinase
MAEIVVEDNGPGVPRTQQADLFKRFFRGDGQSDVGVDSGAGLGLAIVHDIMVLHRGSVHYEDAPEGGARFIVRIPLVPIVVQSDTTDSEPKRPAKKSAHSAPVDL